MKKILFIISILLLVKFATAQTGIGTTTPINKLDIFAVKADPATSGATANGNLRLGATVGNHVMDFGLSSTNTYAWIQARDKSNYAAANSYNLLLNPNGGYVGIGTTAPTTKLYVNGDITANSIAGTSDIRFKTNIRPVINALEKVKALRGVYFNWNQIAFPEKEFGAQDELGFIAQEVEKIIPEIVSKDKTSEEYRSVKYDKLVALLVEAIKEQQKQIDSLTIKVNKYSKLINKR
jgi:hypothetical protein